MRGAGGEWRDLARWVLSREADGRPGAEGLAEGAQGACQKLFQQLSALIGTEGVRALLLRALHLARAESPFLGAVEVDPQDQSCLKGLRESVAGGEVSAVEEGLVALIATGIWLLSNFIGARLALQQVSKIWPEAPTDWPVSGSSREAT